LCLNRSKSDGERSSVVQQEEMEQYHLLVSERDMICNLDLRKGGMTHTSDYQVRESCKRGKI
jgi:hypothetical protein